MSREFLVGEHFLGSEINAREILGKFMELNVFDILCYKFYQDKEIDNEFKIAVIECIGKLNDITFNAFLDHHIKNENENQKTKEDQIEKMIQEGLNNDEAKSREGDQKTNY